MTETHAVSPALESSSRSRSPIYYGWIIVAVAALAMTATLPGRSHGLGLITEPLIADLGIAHTLFARINLATSLLGAAFCIPVGILLDRFGVRAVLAGVVLTLAVSVLGMTRVTGPLGLFIALLLVRGLGQSALSVVSIAAVGKWFRRRLGIAMGVYSLLLTVGFVGSILWMGAAVRDDGWRSAWATLGWVLLAVVPVSWLLQRNTPEELGQTLDAPATSEATSARGSVDFTLGQALRTPAFWVFALGTAIFNLVWSGVTLFNQSVLAERGFKPEAAVQVMAVLTATGLVSNLVGGAVVRRERLGILLGLGMATLTASLAALPSLDGNTGLWLYASAMGLTGGLVMVIFFAAWSHLFGRAHLGRIQGAAQLISVLASAAGPDLLAECQAKVGAYAPIFYALACVTGVLTVASVLVPLPRIRTLTDAGLAPDASVSRIAPVARET
jgi:MFS transporter, OFA family, oxalate/formate antiporter